MPVIVEARPRFGGEFHQSPTALLGAKPQCGYPETTSPCDKFRADVMREDAGAALCRPAREYPAVPRNGNRLFPPDLPLVAFQARSEYKKALGPVLIRRVGTSEASRQGRCPGRKRWNEQPSVGSEDKGRRDKR